VPRQPDITGRSRSVGECSTGPDQGYVVSRTRTGAPYKDEAAGSSPATPTICWQQVMLPTRTLDSCRSSEQAIVLFCGMDHPSPRPTGSGAVFAASAAPGAPIQSWDAVRVAAAGGGALLTLAVTRWVIEHFSRRGGTPGLSPERLTALTEREREVMVAVAAGLNNEEIAAQLFMSPLTAKTHVSRILTKLNLRDRAQIVAIAYETGLVRPGHA
jgi:DNA-binding CsgD family transcriptional regulator